MTPEERNAAIEATATERAGTLVPPVKQPTLADLHKRIAELEGKSLNGDETNDFHQAQNILKEKHGESRAAFLQNLELAGIVTGDSVPLFLALLNEYEAAPDDMPYPLPNGSGSERWGTGAWTDTEGQGLTDNTDPNVNTSTDAVAGGLLLPTQAQADAIVAQGEAERANG